MDIDDAFDINDDKEMDRILGDETSVKDENEDSCNFEVLIIVYLRIVYQDCWININLLL